MDHFITKCDCGAVLSQCKCPAGQKKITVIERGCADCHNSRANVHKVEVGWRIDNGLGDAVILTEADWKYVQSRIHAHYHGED